MVSAANKRKCMFQSAAGNGPGGCDPDAVLKELDKLSFNPPP